MKCRKCGCEIPLKDSRCPQCHAKLYSIFSSFSFDTIVKLSYVYCGIYILFGAVLPQYFAWEYYFKLAKLCVIVCGLISVALPILAIVYLWKDKKRNKWSLNFQYAILAIHIAVSFFYYDMLLRLIEYILM